MTISEYEETLLKEENELEEVPFSIAPEHTRMVMSTLSRLYSEPFESVMREYTSNAYDSHKKAGQSKPVIVKLIRENPTTQSILIKDCGTGMSKKELLESFTQYGTSSKKDDPNFIGLFGLGGKSAFALVNKFVITTIKDNKFVKAEATLSDIDGVNLKVLEYKNTTEPNSFHVYIPNVPNNAVNMNLHALHKMFYMWKPKTIIINNEFPPSIYDSEDFLKLTGFKDRVDGFTPILFSKNATVLADNINFFNGPVRYELSVDELTKIGVKNAGELRGHYIYLPLGSIELTPSREKFMWTEKTKETVRQAVTNYIEILKTKLDTVIGNMNEVDKIKFVLNNKKLVHVLNLRYNFVKNYHNITFDKKLVTPLALIHDGKRVRASQRTIFYDTLSVSNDFVYTQINNDAIIIEGTEEEFKKSWLTLYRLAYASAEKYEKPNKLDIIFVKNANKFEDDFIAKLFPIVTKEEFLRKAKKWLKDNKENTKRPKQKYFSTKQENNKVVPEIIEDIENIDAEKTVIVSVVDRVIPTSYQERYYADIKTKKMKDLKVYVHYSFDYALAGFKAFNPKIENMVILGKKSENPVRKLNPNLKSMVDYSSAYYETLNDLEKQSLILVANLMMRNKFNEFQSFISLAHHIHENHLPVKNPLFETIFRMWGGDRIKNETYLKSFFTATNLRYIIPNFEHFVSLPKNSLLNITPLIFSQYVGIEQIISYLDNLTDDDIVEKVILAKYNPYAKTVEQSNYQIISMFLDSYSGMFSMKERFYLY